MKVKNKNLFYLFVLVSFFFLIYLFFYFGIPEKFKNNFFPSTPSIIYASVKPEKVSFGDRMFITVKASDKYGIKRVTVDMAGIDKINLTLVKGTQKNGTWYGIWYAHDVKTGAHYKSRIIVENVKGKVNYTYVSWSDDPWFSFRRSITAPPFSSFGIKIDTASLIAAGKMRSDCGDIRFTDSKSFDSGLWQRNFSYNIENCNSGNTVVYINVPKGVSRLYMYYGNPEVTSISNSSISGWLYRKPITINNTLNNQNLTNYQVKLSVDTASLIAAGKMRGDCGDMRFTYVNSSGEYKIPYWIESGCNSSNTVVWIKVPFIPGKGLAKVYMYYGNPEAESESNASEVFIIYEDWSSGNLDGWQEHFNGYTAEISESEGNPPPEVNISGDSPCCYDQFIYKVVSKPKGLGLRIIADHAGYHGYYTNNVYTQYYIYASNGTKLDSYNYNGDANNQWIYNDEWIVNSTEVLDEQTVWVGFGLADAWDTNYNQNARFDNIRVGFYTFPDPNVNIGEEETAEVSSEEWSWIKLGGNLLVSGLKIK